MNPMSLTSAIVYIIDDDSSVRTALEDLLASVGIATRSFASTQDFLAHRLTDAPGCLVLDVRMPGQSGLDFQRQMQTLALHLPVIFITGHGDVAMCAQAMKAGAIEFLEKPFREQDLLDAIHHGITRDHQRRSRAQVAHALQARWASLVAGERDVVRLVVQGLLNKQIAYQLQLSEITVKVRRANAMRKMQAKSLADLVRMVESLGVGQAGPDQGC